MGMSVSRGKKDVRRLRTFADDVERAKDEKGVSDKEAAEALRNDAEEKSGVFHTVKKKSLDLKDTSEQPTDLDSDGISFDEETASQVAEQAYEEHKAVKDDSKDNQAGVDIRQTDSVDTIAKDGSATAPIAQPGAEPAPAPAKKPAPQAAPATTTPTQTQPAPTQAAEPKPTPAKPENTSFEQDVAETIDQIPDEAPTDRDSSDAAHVVSNDDVAGGEIVSDKKRERFKIVPAIVDSVSNWFSDTKKQYEEARREKHTVAKVEDRVDTIKAAAQQRTLAPDEDYAQVAQRLKKTKRAPKEAAPVVVKPKSNEKPRWTHTTEEAGQETPTTQAPESAVAQTQTETPAKAPAAADAAPVVHEPIEADMSPDDIDQMVADQPAAAPATGQTTETTAQTPPAPTGKGFAIPQSTKQKGFSLPNISLPNLSRDREFLPSPKLAIGVVVIAIIAGVGTSLFFFGGSDDAGTIPQATTDPLFTAELQTGVTVGATHNETMSTLLSAVNSNPGTLYIYLTRPGTQAIVPPTEVMAFLAPQAPGSFTRSITNVSFGAYNNLPFIVLETNNFDNAFSGMLAWEQTMSADLAPLFGPTVTESYDPQARTADQTRSPFFRDVVASNLSGRLLSNERGEDRLIYAFMDKQTIVIATDRLQLQNILPLIR